MRVCDCRRRSPCVSNICTAYTGQRHFHLERPQLCHHVALHADRLLRYLFFLVSCEEEVLFQLHRDSGILLNLPPCFAFEQLKVGGVSEMDGMHGLRQPTVPYVWSRKSSKVKLGFLNASWKIFANVDTE